MKTLVTDAQRSLMDEESYKVVAEVLLETSLHYSDVWDDDTGYVSEEATGIQDDPLAQDVIWDPINNKMITVFCDGDVYGFKLQILVEGNATPLIPLDSAVEFTLAGEWCKPAAIVWDSELYVFINQADGIHRLILDLSDVIAGTAECTIDDTLIWNGNTNDGSLFCLDHGSRVGFIEIIEGGFKPTYIHYDSTWKADSHPTRMMINEEMQDEVTDRHRTGNATAVNYGNNLFFYISNPQTGEIYKTQRKGITDGTNGQWGDFRLVVGSDLSVANVVDAIVTSNSEILMSVQFTRTQFEGVTRVYNLVLRSIDGGVFSIDRFTAVSIAGYRLFITVPEDTTYPAPIARRGLWVSNSNRHTNLGLGYRHASHSEDRYRIPGDRLKNISMSFSGTNGIISIDIANGDAALTDVAQLQQEGAKATVLFGYISGTELNFVEYLQGIVSKISWAGGDAKKTIKLEILAETQWLLANTHYPYYQELTSRSAVYDDLDELDNMYVAPGQGASESNFYVDWWGALGFKYDIGTEEQTGTLGGVGHEGFYGVGAHKIGSKTQDLKTKLGIEDYPVTAQSTITVEVYGWSKSDADGNPVSTVTPILIGLDDNGNEVTYLANSLQSTYDEFPKRWTGSAIAGSEPIDWDFTTIPVGTSIKYCAVLIEGVNDSLTYISRMEVSGVSLVSEAGDLNSPWELKDAGGLQVPGQGQPYVMFSTRPYHSQGFRVAAEFSFAGGDLPNTVGETKYGIVGLAADAKNLVGAFINTVLDTVEITVVRDGTETVLATASTTILNASSSTMLFEYRGGRFRVYGLNGSTWELVVEYEWLEADGVLTVSDGLTQLNHVGIWGQMDPLFFKTPSFDASDCDGIGIIAGEPFAVFQGLATPGEVQIGDNVYSFTGKSGTEESEGPFQARNTFSWWPGEGYTNVFTGEVFSGGLAIEFRWFRYGESKTYRQNYMAISDNGHGWSMQVTDWASYIYTAGSPVFLPNRSRWFGNNVNGDWIGTRNRVWVSSYLSGITLIEGEEMYHGYASRCKIRITDGITCERFFGANDTQDSTVKDMITTLARAAGGDAEFPGDIVYSSLALSADTETEI